MCFTLLTNFHDARTVPFCLTTDLDVSHDVLCTLQDSTVLVCSGYVSGSEVSVLISDVGMSGTEHSQHSWSVPWRSETEHSQHPWSVPWRSETEHSQRPWSPMEFGSENWYRGNLAASMESHGELGAEACQHSWGTMQSW